MNLNERIIDYLKVYAHTLIDNGQFSILEDIANFANALKTGQWERIPDDEKAYWLKRFTSRFGHMIIDGGTDDPNIIRAVEIINQEIKHLTRR
jgi:hypothetical protein